MKKLALFLLAVLFASSAFATAPLRSGLYVGTKAGVVRANMKKEGENKEAFAFPFAVALGLRIRHVRLEAEYTFSSVAKKDNYEQQTDTMFAQLYYDIPFKSPIRPFLNVGAGRHVTKIKEKNVYKDERHGLAYNLGAGVTWNVSTAVNIDLGYRYLNVGDLKTRTGTVKPKQHIAYIGWRYVF